MTIDQLRAATLMTAAVTPPAIAIFRHLGRGLRLTERMLLTLSLAPFALAIPALGLALAIPADKLARLAGPPIGRWLWPSVFIWTVLALWPTKPSDPAAPNAEPVPDRGTGFPAIAAIATAVCAAFLVGAIALSGAYVLTSGGAWTNAAAVTEIGRSGVPPQDPNFAGIPLHQPWLFHFGVALLQRTAGISIFEEFGLVNVWAVLVLVLAMAQLAYRAFGRAAAMWAGAIAMLGLNPLGWTFAFLRRHDREFAGTGDLLGRLGTGSGAADLLSHRFSPDHVSLLHRFWDGGPLMPAVALAAACAWSVARALERPSARAVLRVLALAVAAFAFEPTAAALSLSALGGGVLVAAVARGRVGAGVGVLALLAVVFAAAFACARSWGLHGVTMEMRWSLYEPALWALLLAVGPWLPIGAPALGAWRGSAAATTLILATAILSVLLALILWLPPDYVSWPFTIAWVALSPVLAAGWVWWSERLRLPAMARVTIFAALVIPTTGLFALGTAADPTSPGVVVRGGDPATRKLPLGTADESEAYRYIRYVLDPDAVVIEKLRPTRNEPVTVLGQRRVFCGRLDDELAGRLGRDRLEQRAARALVEEFRVRRNIQDALFETGILDEQQMQYLVQFSAPLYLLVRRSELTDPVWYGFGGRSEWSELVANHEVKLYRFVREERLNTGF